MKAERSGKEVFSSTKFVELRSRNIKSYDALMSAKKVLPLALAFFDPSDRSNRV